MPNVKKPCPFTEARLNELYWFELKPLGVIAKMADVSISVVKRWLSEAGIRLRNRSEIIKTEWITHRPAKTKSVSTAIIQTNAVLASTRSADHLHTKQVAKKISQAQTARLAKKREALIITVYCEWCQSELKRMPCKVKEHNFCNRNHMMLCRQSQNRRNNVKPFRKRNPNPGA